MTDVERVAQVAERIRNPLASEVDLLAKVGVHLGAGAVGNCSRTDAAMRGFAKAVDRIRQLEGDLLGAFEALNAAQENLAHENISVSVIMAKPVESAWAAWRNMTRDPEPS